MKLSPILFYALFLAAGCTRNPTQNTQSPSPEEPEYVKEARQREYCQNLIPVAAYRRTEALSEKIWNYFEKMKWPKTKNGKLEVRRYYDFGCSISDSSTQIAKCYYSLTPAAKRIESGAPQDVMTEFRTLLFDYPIANGDSGAMTKYITCEKDGTSPAYCNIAINIDYTGP